MNRSKRALGGCLAASTILFVLFSMLPTPVLAVNFPSFPDPTYYQHYCLPGVDNVVGYSATVEVTNLTNITDIDKFVFAGSSVCQFNCSQTLQDCRQSPPMQFVWALVYVIALGLIAYFAPALGAVGLVAGAIAFVFSLFMAVFDIFTWPTSIVIQAFPLVFILFLTIHWYLSRNDQSGEGED